MKKIISIVLAAALTATLLVCCAGCDKEPIELESSWDVPDYVTLGTVAEGKTALALYTEALENYYSAEYMAFVRSMDFDAGVIATQQTIDITKCYGDEMFYQVTKQGTAAGAVNYGKRFYSDGTNAWEVSEDSEDRFPELGTADWSDMDYAAYDASETSVADKLADMRNFTLYVINADTLSDSHDENVYSYDGKYYICLTIDCMGIEEGTTQNAVEEDIMGGLGDSAVPGTFEWRDDTKIYMEITDIDGKMYITARSLQEFYKAKQSILPVSCDQITSGTYSYEEAACIITEDEKMNLD